MIHHGKFQGPACLRAAEAVGTRTDAMTGSACGALPIAAPGEAELLPADQAGASPAAVALSAVAVTAEIKNGAAIVTCTHQEQERCLVMSCRHRLRRRN